MQPDSARPGHRLSWRAALLGGAVGIAASAFFGTLAANITLWVLTSRGLTLQDAYGELFYSTPQIVIGQSVTFLSEVSGGYTAASLAPARPVIHGLLAGAMTLLFAVVAYATPASNSYPLWMMVLNLVTPVPAAILGAYVCARRA